jgi:hypothetical protein
LAASGVAFNISLVVRLATGLAVIGSLMPDFALAAAANRSFSAAFRVSSSISRRIASLTALFILA